MSPHLEQHAFLPKGSFLRRARADEEQQARPCRSSGSGKHLLAGQGLSSSRHKGRASAEKEVHQFIETGVLHRGNTWSSPEADVKAGGEAAHLKGQVLILGVPPGQPSGAPRGAQGSSLQGTTEVGVQQPPRGTQRAPSPGDRHRAYLWACRMERQGRKVQKIWFSLPFSARS